MNAWHHINPETCYLALGFLKDRLLYIVSLIMASNENGDGNNGQLGYKGYQWEPEYTEEELAEIHSGSLDRNSVHARSTDLSWCTCNLCTPMRQLQESTCCQEFEHYTADYLTDTISCITLHEDFALICLNPLVLETAYVTFLRYKRQSGRAPDVLSSR